MSNDDLKKTKTIKVMLSAVRRDPVGAIDECRVQLSSATKGFQALRRALLAQAYAVSFEFTDHPDKWQQFIEGQNWIELGMPTASRSASPLQVIRSVMFFVLNAHAQSTKKRARRYAQALAPFLDAREAPKLVAKKLSKSGIERFIKDAAQARKAERETSKKEDEEALNRYIEVDDGHIAAGESVDTSAAIEPAIDRDFIEPTTVEIELSQRQFAKLVNFPAGQRARIVVEAGERAHNWTPITVVRFKTLSPE